MRFMPWGEDAHLRRVGLQTLHSVLRLALQRNNRKMLQVRKRQLSRLSEQGLHEDQLQYQYPSL
jgi:hypothetical protein